MRLKKLKNARKTMGFFRVHFKIYPPYRIIMDGCFLHNSYKVHFLHLLRRLMQADIDVAITRCATHELELIGEATKPTLEAAKRLRLLKCGHQSEALSPADCIKQQIGANNSKKYIVASTDKALLSQLRVRNEFLNCCVYAIPPLDCVDDAVCLR